MAIPKHLINVVAAECHAISEANGFWDGKTPRAHGAEKIALMHSELSEVLEELRKPEVDWRAVGAELADIVIRVFDYAAAAEIDIAQHILDKMELNRHRPHKHGKAF